MFLVLHQTEYQIFTFIAGEGSLGKVEVTLVILSGVSFGKPTPARPNAILT